MVALCLEIEFLLVPARDTCPPEVLQLGGVGFHEL